MLRVLRSGVAGFAATLADLVVLTTLVSLVHVPARVASLPALVAGGVVNFAGNRWFAFRAHEGNLARQAALYTLVEGAALALNAVLFDAALRAVPALAGAYAAVRLVTSHVVFVAFSYPLWQRIFARPSGA